MFVVFVKFVISWFSGWFMTGIPEPEETLSENSAEEALDIATKKADEEEEKKKKDKSKHSSGGLVDSNTKEEGERKREIKKLAEIASEKNRILKEEIKKEEEFLLGSRETHKKLLEIKEQQANEKDSNSKKRDSAISIADALKAKIKKRNSGMNND
jgi:hypothetical protein